MTRDEIIDVLSTVAILWPHSDLGDPQEAIAGWFGLLGEFTQADVETVVKRLSGREQAPPPGVIRARVLIDAQGPAPSFDDAQAWLSRNLHGLPVDASTPHETVIAIEQLEQRGAHEALLRWVQSVGIYAARMCPDGSLVPLDPGQAADRRDRVRDYEHRVLADWRADPRPGLALERAQRALLAPSTTAGLRRMTPVAALNEGGDR